MQPTGWIIYNGNLPSPTFRDFAEMIQGAAARKQSQTKLFKNNELLAQMDEHALHILNQSMDTLPDYVVFLDKDIYLARQFEGLNIPVFNSAQSIAMSDDKIATYQALVTQNLPIPKTIIAPKVFIHAYHTSYDLEGVINQLGLPLIVKEAFGSFGEQVYLIHTMEELKQLTSQLHGSAFMFQEFIESSYGRDLRLQVVGNQVVAAVKRTSENDFRANVTSGGSMTVYEPSTYEKALAVAATKAIGADFAGVDLLFGQTGPLICEINSNAHIRNLYDATNTNAADAIMDHILTKTTQQKKEFL